jgi:MFS family permease
MSKLPITEPQYLEPDITADPKPQLDDIELEKTSNDFTPKEERRLVRKIDRWIIPLLMVTYTLQSYDKGVMSAATQFGFNTDLGLTTVIGTTSTGAPITNNEKYSNASMMFYIGYLVGTYPMMYLSQRFPTSRVIAIAVFLWGAVLMSTAGCTNFAGIMINRLG